MFMEPNKIFTATTELKVEYILDECDPHTWGLK